MLMRTRTRPTRTQSEAKGGDRGLELSSNQSADQSQCSVINSVGRTRLSNERQRAELQHTDTFRSAAAAAILEDTCQLMQKGKKYHWC